MQIDGAMHVGTSSFVHASCTFFSMFQVSTWATAELAARGVSSACSWNHFVIERDPEVSSLALSILFHDELCGTGVPLTVHG
jgi:hypothetical protein